MDYEMKDFNKDILERSKTIPVLVDFWAEWWTLPDSRSYP